VRVIHFALSTKIEDTRRTSMIVPSKNILVVCEHSTSSMWPSSHLVPRRCREYIYIYIRAEQAASEFWMHNTILWMNGVELSRRREVFVHQFACVRVGPRCTSVRERVWCGRPSSSGFRLSSKGIYAAESSEVNGWQSNHRQSTAAHLLLKMYHSSSEQHYVLVRWLSDKQEE
jgi:hypothetical protein